MKLIDLEPQFIRYEERMDTWKTCAEDHVHTLECGQIVQGLREYHIEVPTLAEAQGVQFLCPKCCAANGGNVGTHDVLVWFRDRGVPDKAEPGAAYAPGQSAAHPNGRPAQRWTIEGTGFADLTTKPSIALEGGCAWHGFVTAGDAA